MNEPEYEEDEQKPNSKIVMDEKISALNSRINKAIKAVLFDIYNDEDFKQLITKPNYKPEDSSAYVPQLNKLLGLLIKDYVVCSLDAKEQFFPVDDYEGINFFNREDRIDFLKNELEITAAEQGCADIEYDEAGNITNKDKVWPGALPDKNGSTALERLENKVEATLKKHIKTSDANLESDIQAVGDKATIFR